MGTVLLVRHGQASFGADDYDVLSETGWEQSRALGEWLRAAGVKPDLVFRGDMRRHRETALGLGLGDATEDAGWNEFDHLGVVAAWPDLPSGDLDRRAFQQVFEEATGRWASGEFDDDYPESFPAFTARVRGALDRACAEAGPGRTVVVVSSGGPIALACAALVGGEETSYGWSRFNTTCVNTGVTRVVVGSTGARLLTYNEHGHLSGDLLTYR